MTRDDYLRALAGSALSRLAELDPGWSLTDVERLHHALAHQVVDEATVEDAEAILERHSRMYFRLGSFQMLQLVGDFVRSTMMLASGQMPDALRARLAAVITEDAGRAAWLAYDVGRSVVSSAFYAIAEDAARRCPPHEGAYVSAYRGIISVHQGHIREALALTEEAADRGRDADPSMRAWIAAMAAQAAAMAQDRPRTVEALREAHAQLDTAARAPGNRLFWLDAWRLAALEAGAYARLGDGPEAERRMRPALPFLEQRSPRGRSEMQLDLAAIALLNGEDDEAVHLARESLASARAAQSVASADLVRQFRLRLHTLGRRPDLNAFDADLVSA